MYTSFRPGKTWYDTNGKRIQAHGGSVLYAENKFWWYGENKEGITGTATGERCPYWHHGVKIYSSTDLYNWTDEGFAMRESDDPKNPFYPANIMDRPHILHCPKTGKYVLWAKTARGGFDHGTFSVCVGDKLTDMKLLREISPRPHNAGDFDLFEADGKAYVAYENPHSEMICRELTDDYTDLTDAFSSHLPFECPPLVREAPAFFERGQKRYLLTSGTTGYYPNPSRIDEMTSVHGKWKNLGNPCRGDKRRNSFHAQFSSVFRHPFLKDVYIALGDRWLTDLVADLPDMEDAFYSMFSKNAIRTFNQCDLASFTDNNTSEADYVWLPVKFDGDAPYIEWLREWKLTDICNVQ